jgi:hypothetical protein
VIIFRPLLFLRLHIDILILVLPLVLLLFIAMTVGRKYRRRLAAPVAAASGTLQLLDASLQILDVLDAGLQDLELVHIGLVALADHILEGFELGIHL